MPIQKVNFRPGIVRDVTQYTNENGWYDADKVRFRLGYPEKLGGWQKYTQNLYEGYCRDAHPWVSLDNEQFISLGTHLKLYIMNGGAFYDITPIRINAFALVGNPFATTNLSKIVTVTHTAHGAVAGDFVTFAGSGAVGGIPAADINKEQRIASIIDANSYTFQTATQATSTTTGGAGATATYQINTGLQSVISGTGWGAGTWSSGPWGGPSPISVAGGSVRLWTQDHWGEDLVATIENGPVYYWDRTTGLTTRAVNITTLGGATDPPEVAVKCLVSDTARHLVALGCDDLSSSTQDPMLVRWSDSEDLTDWTPSTTNQAGGFRLSSGSKIITGARVKNEILIWTDGALYTMNYLGGTFVFSFSLVSDQTTIVSQHAYAILDNIIYWMDNDHFNMYSGTVQTVECPIQSYVFNDFNYSQRANCFCATVQKYNEIWWFYPSADSDEIDRYVIYNYQEKSWSIGSLVRSAWVEAPFETYPLGFARTITESTLGSNPFSTTNGSTTVTVSATAHGAVAGDLVLFNGSATFNNVTIVGTYIVNSVTDANTFTISASTTANATSSGGGSSVTVDYSRGNVFSHENGYNDENGLAISSYIESSDFDLEDGGHFIFVRRIIPDVAFADGLANQTVDFVMKVRDFPANSKTTEISRTVTDSTRQIWDRARGRQATVRWESDVASTQWRIGTLRLDLQPDGEK